MNKCLTTLYPAWAQSRAAKVRLFSLGTLHELLLVHTCVSWCLRSSSSSSSRAHGENDHMYVHVWGGDHSQSLWGIHTPVCSQSLGPVRRAQFAACQWGMRA